MLVSPPNNSVQTHLIADSKASSRVGEDFMDNEQVVLILVGLIGSGKSTFAEALERFFPKFLRCNQDDLGNRRKVELLATKTLRQGLSVCIDRTNFDDIQRAHFINIARSFPNTVVWALVFDTPYETCASRLRSRTNHPTIKSPEQGLSVLNRFAADYHPPVAQEGFDRIMLLSPHPTGIYSRDEIASIIDDIRRSPPLRSTSSSLSSRRLHFFRGGYSGGGRVHDYRHRGSSSPSSWGPLSNADNEGWRSGPPSPPWRKGSDVRKDGVHANSCGAGTSRQSDETMSATRSARND